jgi:uncharacterized membrane protein
VLIYTILKFVHIFLAIVAVGFNASYGIWLARAAREPEHLLHVLRGIKYLDSRFANPAYGLLLVTGLSMVFVLPWPITTFWILAALVLWLITLAIGGALLAPAFRKQRAALESQGAASPQYQALAKRARTLGMLAIIPVVLILILMVFKPTL